MPTPYYSARQRPGDPNVIPAGPVTTTDATPTTVITFALPDDASTYIDARAVARFQGGSGQAVFLERALYFRTGGGGATLEGIAPTEPLTEKTPAALDFALVISGDDVLLVVTGIAAQSWNWNVSALRVVQKG